MRPSTRTKKSRSRVYAVSRQYCRRAAGGRCPVQVAPGLQDELIAEFHEFEELRRVSGIGVSGIKAGGQGEFLDEVRRRSHRDSLTGKSGGTKGPGCQAPRTPRGPGAGRQKAAPQLRDGLLLEPATSATPQFLDPVIR